MMRHLDIKIYGRVQGVFFRHSAKKHGERLGIAGFARNEPDSSVYIEAEGNEENLNKFLDWCREGPTFAKVEKIDFVWNDEIKNFDGFRTL